MENNTNPIRRYWTSEMQLHTKPHKMLNITENGDEELAGSNDENETNWNVRQLQEASSEGHLLSTSAEGQYWTKQITATINQISRECLDRLTKLESENRQLRQKCQNLEAQMKSLDSRGLSPQPVFSRPMENGKQCSWSLMDSQLRQLINILVHTNLAQNNIQEDCRYLKTRVSCLEEANERLFSLVRQHYPDFNLLPCTSKLDSRTEPMVIKPILRMAETYPRGDTTGSASDGNHDTRRVKLDNRTEQLEKDMAKCISGIAHRDLLVTDKAIPTNLLWPTMETPLIRTASAPSLPHPIEDFTAFTCDQGPTWKLRVGPVDDTKPDTGRTESFMIKEKRSERTSASWFKQTASHDSYTRRGSAPDTCIADLVPHAWLQMTSLPTNTVFKRQPVGTRSHVILGSRFLPLESNESKKSGTQKHTNSIEKASCASDPQARQSSLRERNARAYSSELHPIEEIDSSVQSFRDLKISSNIEECTLSPSHVDSIKKTLPSRADQLASSPLKEIQSILCRDKKLRYLHPVKLFAKLLSFDVSHTGNGKLRQSVDLETLLYEQEKMHKCRDAQRDLRYSVFSDTELLTGKFNITSTDDSAIESGEDEDMQSSNEFLVNVASTEQNPNTDSMKRRTPEGKPKLLRMSSEHLDSASSETTERRFCLDSPKSPHSTVERSLRDSEYNGYTRAELNALTTPVCVEHYESIGNSNLSDTGKSTRTNVPPPVVIHRKRFGLSRCSQANTPTIMSSTGSDDALGHSADKAILEARVAPTGHSTPEPASSDNDSLVFAGTSMGTLSSEENSADPSTMNFPTAQLNTSTLPTPEPITEKSGRNYLQVSSCYDGTATLTRGVSNKQPTETVAGKSCVAHVGDVAHGATVKNNSDHKTNATASGKKRCMNTTRPSKEISPNTVSNLPVNRPATSPRIRRASAITALPQSIASSARMNSARRSSTTSTGSPTTQLPLPSRSFPSSPAQAGSNRKYRTHVNQSIVKVLRSEKSISISRAELNRTNESGTIRLPSSIERPSLELPCQQLDSQANDRYTEPSTSSKCQVNPPPIPPRTTSRGVAHHTNLMNSHARLNSLSPQEHRQYEPHFSHLSPRQTHTDHDSTGISCDVGSLCHSLLHRPSYLNISRQPNPAQTTQPTSSNTGILYRDNRTSDYFAYYGKPNSPTAPTDKMLNSTVVRLPKVKVQSALDAETNADATLLPSQSKRSAIRIDKESKLRNSGRTEVKREIYRSQLPGQPAVTDVHGSSHHCSGNYPTGPPSPYSPINRRPNGKQARERAT